MISSRSWVTVSIAAGDGRGSRRVVGASPARELEGRPVTLAQQQYVRARRWCRHRTAGEDRVQGQRLRTASVGCSFWCASLRSTRQRVLPAGFLGPPASRAWLAPRSSGGGGVENAEPGDRLGSRTGSALRYVKTPGMVSRASATLAGLRSRRGRRLLASH